MNNALFYSFFKNFIQMKMDHCPGPFSIVSSQRKNNKLKVKTTKAAFQHYYDFISSVLN